MDNLSFAPTIIAGEKALSLTAPSVGLTILIPAYNEGHGIRTVVQRIQALKPSAELIVVDDGSTDNTREEALAGGALVVRHPYNMGNGAAIKTGLRAARGIHLLVIDADGQHDPADIDRLLAGLQDFDMVVGARTSASDSRLSRDIGNSLFKALGSYLVGRRLPEVTGGFRCMNRAKLLEFVHLLPNGYSWTTTSLLSFVKAGYSVQFVPIIARRRSGGKSGIKIFRDGFRFILMMNRVTMLFAPMKVFFPVSLLLFAVGFLYGFVNTVFIDRAHFHIAPGAEMLMMMSVFVFLIGLVSEQIAAMRFERRA